MADFYPVLLRAVSSLPDNTVDARQLVYKRAREALLGQLHTLRPALHAHHIRTESENLDLAIERLEQHLARRSLVEEDELSATKTPEVRRAEFREKLGGVSSPEPSLTSDGQIDAGPNAVFDRPIPHDDLATLPIRQLAVIDTIVTGLPRNAPKHLRRCLDTYSEELKSRGAQPIVGVLKDLAAIIAAEVSSSDAEAEWISSGLKQAFNIFQTNNTAFMQHFPLDPVREELYASTPVKEEKAVGDTLSMPFQEVASATANAKQAGITTTDFLLIVDKLSEFAQTVASLPVRPNDEPVGAKSVPPQDQATAVSARKRIILSGLGFFERVYNLLGTTASLTAPPEGNALLLALRKAINSLSRLLGF